MTVVVLEMIAAFIVGGFSGLLVGIRLGGRPHWYDTTEGINRRLRRKI